MDKDFHVRGHHRNRHVAVMGESSEQSSVVSLRNGKEDQRHLGHHQENEGRL